MAREITRTPEIRTETLADDGTFPNHPRWPLLCYKGALRVGPDTDDDFAALVEANEWGGAWRDGVFSFHHYHSNAHEVLGVCRGSARIQFGGPSGPVVAVEAGDVTILPAGTAHKKVQGSARFLVVGAYPEGHEDYDLLRGAPDERPAADHRIAAVPLPPADPVFGPNGPLFEHWRG